MERKKKMKDRDLEDRIFNFAVEVIKFLKTLKHSEENNVIRYQLAKAATSIGANYEEAQGAFSRDDFKYKIGICLKEAKESNYWLRIIKTAGLSEGDELGYLINESTEIKNIFGSILKKIHFRKDMKQKE